jgi:hypothetical protein
MMKIRAKFKQGMSMTPFNRDHHRYSHHAMLGTGNLLIRVCR